MRRGNPGRGSGQLRKRLAHDTVDRPAITNKKELISMLIGMTKRTRGTKMFIGVACPRMSHV
jgi:hypothetical protein